MRNDCKIKKNAEYRAVYGNGKSAANRHLVVYIKENGLGANRFGITVSRKVGKAVVRNKVKRRLRAVIHTFCVQSPHAGIGNHYDIVVIARQGAGEAVFAELREGFTKLLIKMKVYNAAGERTV